MKILVEGHKYALEAFEEGGEPQELYFIHKEQLDATSPELTTIYNGTTNEEVLAVLINRLNYLQSKFSCIENAIVITKLEESLMWLNKRTEERKKRGVEGKHLK